MAVMLQYSNIDMTSYCREKFILFKSSSIFAVFKLFSSLYTKVCG